LSISADMRRSIADLKMQFELEKIEQFKRQVEIEKYKLQAQYEMVKQVLQQGPRGALVTELIKTEQNLPNGDKIVMTLTSAQSIDKLAKADFDKIMWSLHCLKAKDTVSKTFKEIQECKCAYCQTACVTLLKWRMIR